MSRRLKLALNCIRSLWYLAHGFTVHSEKNILSGKGRRCLLKYNSKGVQTEHVISPIELKQLAVPFTILFVGYFLATTAFIGELIYHKFVGRRAAGNKVAILKNGNAEIKPVPQRQHSLNKKTALNKVRADHSGEDTIGQFITQNEATKTPTMSIKVDPSKDAGVKIEPAINQTVAVVEIHEIPTKIKKVLEPKTSDIGGTMIKPKTIHPATVIGTPNIIDLKNEILEITELE